MNIDPRMQPHSTEAEKSVLGSMMLDANAVISAVEVLTAEDFYAPAHRELYDAMLTLNAQGRPVDLVTLTDELYRRGSMEGVGGVLYLTELSRYVPTTVNARSYVRIVEEKSILRRLIRASGHIADDSYEGAKPVPDILDDAEKRIYDIAMKRSGDALTHINPLLIRAMERIEHLYVNRGQVDGVPSGFTELDRLTTGFHGGEFILVGARPSMGKTAFMLNIAQYAAVRHKKTVAYFSLEMPREQLANRLLCSEALVDMQAVRQGNLADEDWDKLARAMSPLAQAPIYIDDTSSITISEMRSRLRRMQIERGLDIVFIDYLQLMNPEGRHNSGNRQTEISEISRQMKILSQELKVPVIAGSQLSRALEGRPNKRPLLSDLRDSGAIEQDADVVMFLYRDDYYNPETDEKNVAEVIVGKQRNGPLGTVRLAFLNTYTRFSNLP
jgi:replicative DNA helicase